MESLAVKKKSYMIYYPDLTEEQHKDIINIRVDPKTNLVPVITTNSNHSLNKDEDNLNISIDS